MKKSKSIQVWKCLKCNWKSEKEPPFTEKACKCCWDFQCPRCGGAIENDWIKKEIKHE